MASPVLVSAGVINVGHIDDVQELNKTKTSRLPPRFVRDREERPAFSSINQESPIPVIDLSKLQQQKGKNKDHEFESELQQLAASCENWGFFQLINHGIDSSLLENMEKMAMDFFMLPLEEKQKYPMTPGTAHGYGQAFVFSEDQKLDWINMFALGLEPHSIRNPNLWPTEPAHFGETMDAYSNEIMKLSKALLKYIALSLGLEDENVFEDMFGVAVQASRMNYYPPCPRPDLVLGLSPHSDGSAVTVLQQGRGSPVGLHILKDGEWVAVPPVPGALVINIGDTVEVLSNGRYKSVEHRAVVNEEKERLSIVTFYAPGYDVEVGPMPEMVDQNNPPKYRRYNHGEYSRNYLGNKLHRKKALEFTKLQLITDE